MCSNVLYCESLWRILLSCLYVHPLKTCFHIEIGARVTRMVFFMTDRFSGVQFGHAVLIAALINGCSSREFPPRHRNSAIKICKRPLPCERRIFHRPFRSKRVDAFIERSERPAVTTHALRRGYSFSNASLLRVRLRRFNRIGTSAVLRTDSLKIYLDKDKKRQLVKLHLR